MRLKLLIGFFAIALPAQAWAEDVRWPTYYPSPAGLYRRLNTTERTQLGTTAGSAVTLATGGGRVGVGIANPVNYFQTANNASYFVNAGNTAGVGLAMVAGGVQGVFSAGGPGTVNLILNPGGSHVGVGSNSSSTALEFEIGGAGTLGFSRGAGTGEYKIGRGTDGDYYPVYAPG